MPPEHKIMAWKTNSYITKTRSKLTNKQEIYSDGKYEGKDKRFGRQKQKKYILMIEIPQILKKGKKNSWRQS